MKTFHQQWHHLRENNLFSSFIPDNYQWSTATRKVIELSQSLPYEGLLSALFQISGVAIPLRLAIKQSQHEGLSWLEKIQTGEVIAAHCMSEPNAGTDIIAMQTNATLKEHGWIINGKKTFICNAPIAQIGLLYTRVAECTQKPPYNLACFLLDLRTPGIHITPLHMLGLPGVVMGTISLENVCIPHSHLIGQAMMGIQMVYMSTTFERLLIPIIFVGLMKYMVEHAPRRKKVELYRYYYTANALMNTGLAQIDITQWQRNYIKLGCLLKWNLSELYLQASRVFGDELLYRDALSSWIYSGTNDVLKATLEKLICD